MFNTFCLKYFFTYLVHLFFDLQYIMYVPQDANADLRNYKSKSNDHPASRKSLLRDT